MSEGRAQPRAAGLFVSWASFSRRSQTLAARFGLELRYVSAPGFKRPLYALVKYPLQIARMVRLLGDTAPREVWVMEPPLPSVAVAWAYCRRRRLPLVVDMHTVGFYALKWRLLRPLEKPLLRRARAVVVTNDELGRRVRSWGCRTVVLPDALPDPPGGLDEAVDPLKVTVVATYSEDEPIDALSDVAERLGQVRIHVTGRPRVATAHWPPNLVATGFLDDDAYWRLLASSAAVVVLTTRPNTLLSGGYEALSLARPLVVSDQGVLRDYFGDAAVYVAETPAAIAAGIRTALDDRAGLSRKMSELAVRRAAEWRIAAQVLAAAVGRSA